MIVDEKEGMLDELLSIKDWRHPYRFAGNPVSLERKELGVWNTYRVEVSKHSIETVMKKDKISILDLACNDGFYGFQLADKAGSVLGVDARKDCIGRANLIKNYYGYKNYNFKEADLRNPDFFESVDVKSGFDLVLCYGILYHVTDPYFFLKRIFNLVNDTLSLSTFLSKSKYPVLTVKKEDISMPGSGLDPISMMPTASAVVRILYQAGFDLVMRYIPYKTSIYNHLEWGHFFAVKLGKRSADDYCKERNVKTKYDRYSQKDQLVLCQDNWDLNGRKSTRREFSLNPSIFRYVIQNIQRRNLLKG